MTSFMAELISNIFPNPGLAGGGRYDEGDPGGNSN